MRYTALFFQKNNSWDYYGMLVHVHDGWILYKYIELFLNQETLVRMREWGNDGLGN